MMKKLCPQCQQQRDRRYFHLVEGINVCGTCYNSIIEGFKKIISTPTPHWINAKVWVGTEQEGKEYEPRLFTDGASVEDINVALHLHPEVKAIYFGHSIDWAVVENFYKRIQCIVEVSNLDEIPPDYTGKITVILRIPTWVNYIKQMDGSIVVITELSAPHATFSGWSGQKVLEGDKIIR
jgi:hypothetical protein